MARSMWSGSISFGLLNVPVKLYSAVARRNIALREVRESDSARIKHRRVAEGTDEEVPYDKIVKAYEITSGRYVQLSNEEMDALRPQKSRSIDVQDFVDIEEIDPMYFDSPYYLGPDENKTEYFALTELDANSALASTAALVGASMAFDRYKAGHAGSMTSTATLQAALEVMKNSEPSSCCVRRWMAPSFHDAQYSTPLA